MKKLKHLLLVDDDPTTNFFNSHLIKKMDVFENIHVAVNGQEALDLIHQLKEKNESPDMIFLDINMPIMNGFEFLTEYEKLEEDAQSVVVCMLTTSLAHEDLIKAQSFEMLNDYIDKPLYKEKITELVRKYFPE